AIRHRAGGGGRTLLRRTAPARHGTGTCVGSTRLAARRAVGGPRRRRARARRIADQAHRRQAAGAAGRARYRPGVRACRPDHGDERRPRAGRRLRWETRESAAVREIYIGSGTAALAARPRGSAARERSPLLLELAGVDAFYGKSHIVKAAS